MLAAIRSFIIQFKRKSTENSFQNLIWLINLFPTILGFSYFDGKIKALFWIFLLVSTFYINIIGTVVYQIHHAEGLVDTLNSYFNVLIFIITYNYCRWFLFERKSLINALELAEKNNDMGMEFEKNPEKHKDIIKSIKNLIIIWYLFHLVNGVFIFIPKRISEMDDCSLSSCVGRYQNWILIEIYIVKIKRVKIKIMYFLIGLEPLSERPNKEVCMLILTAHALFCIITTASYDATFLFLFAHTAAMFEILQEETASLNDINECTGYETAENTRTVEQRLKNLINRHSLILHTVHIIQDIYNVAVGISFGLEAISMCLFFVLPLEAVLNLVPIIIHGLSMFFLYCYQGQKITTAAEGFEKAVYCCGWENFGIKERKMILIMLRQCQKPVILKAASVAPICIYSFAYTMQSIYKLVTAFKT
nr:odorant receptor 18 [Papilio glaucus]